MDFVYYKALLVWGLTNQAVVKNAGDAATKLAEIEDLDLRTKLIAALNLALGPHLSALVQASESDLQDYDAEEKALLKAIDWRLMETAAKIDAPVRDVEYLHRLHEMVNSLLEFSEKNVPAVPVSP